MIKFTFIWFLNCAYSSDGNVNVFEAQTLEQAFQQFYEECPDPDAEIVAVFEGDIQAQHIKPQTYHHLERF